VVARSGKPREQRGVSLCVLHRWRACTGGSAAWLPLSARRGFVALRRVQHCAGACLRALAAVGVQAAGDLHDVRGGLPAAMVPSVSVEGCGMATCEQWRAWVCVSSPCIRTRGDTAAAPQCAIATAATCRHVRTHSAAGGVRPAVQCAERLRLPGTGADHGGGGLTAALLATRRGGKKQHAKAGPFKPTPITTRA
jgi:hypothetical protein